MNTGKTLFEVFHSQSPDERLQQTSTADKESTLVAAISQFYKIISGTPLTMTQAGRR
jgi:hypothetical protein